MNRSKKIFIAISIVLFVSFIFFSYLVAKETFVQSDFNTTVRFQDHLPHRFDLPFSVLSVIGSAEVMAITCFIICLFLLWKKYYKAFFAMFLLPLALSMEIFGKVFVFHPSPPHMFYRGVLQVDFPSNYIQTDYSYPSGHMTRTTFLIFFFALFTLYRFPKKVQIIVFPLLGVFLISMMVSRIYLGEHWTSDVIGGTLIGASFGLFAGSMIPIKKRLNSLHS